MIYDTYLVAYIGYTYNYIYVGELRIDASDTCHEANSVDLTDGTVARFDDPLTVYMSADSSTPWSESAIGFDEF